MTSRTQRPGAGAVPTTAQPPDTPQITNRNEPYASGAEAFSRRVADGYPIGRRQAKDANGRRVIWLQRVLRSMSTVGAAQEIGPTGFALVAVIAAQEDATFYTRGVTFHSAPLMRAIGVKDWETLDRARKAAVQLGWLHYQPPPKGTKLPGLYWSLTPNDIADIPDLPLHECQTPDDWYQLGFLDGCRAEKAGEQYRKNRKECHTAARRRAVRKPDGVPELSSLALDPTPSPEEMREPAAAVAIPEADRLFRLVDGWNALGQTIVKTGNGARRDPPSKAIIKGWLRALKDPERRPAFDDIDGLLSAIRAATFCHKQGWFTFPWLFGTNKLGEPNAPRLLNGAYDSNGHGKHQRQALPCGAGQKYSETGIDIASFGTPRTRRTTPPTTGPV